jgi:hypothetical protein
MRASDVPPDPLGVHQSTSLVVRFVVTFGANTGQPTKVV